MTAYVFKRKPSKCYVLAKKTYWKYEGSESTELSYACYTFNLIGKNSYVYAKLPLGSSTKALVNKNGENTLAASPSELVENALSPYTISSVNESSLTFTYSFMGGTQTQNCTRYKEGDLYEKVGTQVTVPGTESDYDFIANRYYTLRRK